MTAPVLASYALKGGVGKTSTAVNVAWLSAESGRRTLLWDLDPQAGSSFLLRAKPKVKGGARGLLQGSVDPSAAVKHTGYERLDILPGEALYETADVDLDAAKKSSRRVERIVDALGADYDLIVLDCPPGLSLLSRNVIRAADLLLVPLAPTPMSLRTLDHVVDFGGDEFANGTRLLGFWSMVDARRAMHRQVMSVVGDEYRDMATTAIPASAVIERMAQRRAPVLVSAPTSPAAAAYRALWDEVVQRLWP